ncbi:glycosyltransferase family 4 protein [Devriesea agamarum]|uniref:glycosyltransferase family 4 protein n=1 Tax=Devriesea agamarum TaxID=472569 RepID=UPI001E34A59D|nr:glycosyltransferase family 1 protein [Devriesea agamarum]
MSEQTAPGSQPPLRIAIFTEVFLPKVDGVVTTLLHTIDELTAAGHEVLVFAPGKGPDHYGSCRVVRVRALPFRPWYPEISVGMPGPTISREFMRFQPDVVHACSPVWLAAYGVLYARRRHTPIVASYHTDIPRYMDALGLKYLRPAATAWLRRLHNSADVNLCPSRPLIDEARAGGLNRVSLWPGAVDTALFHPTRRCQEMRARLTNGDVDRPVVLSVGRLSKEKGLDQLITTMEMLPHARIAFVGSGPHETQLKHRFAHLPATFLGHMSGIELATAFASADVFAFPSCTDTLGLVSLESMASGVPVVGCRAGGIPDTIRDGETGFLVDPHDPHQMAARLGVILDNPGIRDRMGAAARLDAEKRSWSLATATLLSAYRTAIARQRVGTVTDLMRTFDTVEAA